MTDTNPQAELFMALAKAQSEMKNAPLNKVNPHFKSKYADLSSIRDTVMPSLTKNGISVIQMPMVDDAGRNVLVTALSHSSGGTVQSQTPICADTSKAQPYGSALTYARRYGLASMCCISSDEDDDGNAAQAAAPQVVTAAQAKELGVLIEQKGVDADVFMKYYKVSTLSELPASKFARAVESLNKKADV